MKNKSNPISEARLRFGLTQEELANRLDVARNYVYLLESGKKPFSEKIKTKLEMLIVELEKKEVMSNSSAPQDSATDLRGEIDFLKKQLLSKDAVIESQMRTIEKLVAQLGNDVAPTPVPACSGAKSSPSFSSTRPAAKSSSPAPATK